MPGCRGREASRLLLCSCLAVFLISPLVAAVRDNKYYKILGISEDADEATIKKAYRRAALKWHPDRNKDNKEKAEAKFREIAAAYETLSDPEKRQLYDQLGEEGMKQGGPGGAQRGGGAQFEFQGDPFEIFNAFFGGGNPFGGGGGGGGVKFSMGGMGGMPGMGDLPGMGPKRKGRQRRSSQQQGGSSGGSGGGLYDGDANVVSVTSANFPGKSDKEVWLLEFYAPWCGHCRNLAPKWSKVAAALKGVIKVGAVNCDEEKQLCGQHGVQGYPTIKAAVRGRFQDYQGDRSAGALKSFALGLLSSKAVTTLNKPLQVEEFLKLCEGKGPKKASWGACAILFTAKSDTAPLYKSLANQYDGRIAFGESRASNKQLAEQYEIASYPTLVVFCNGDKGTRITYSGELKAAPLHRFLLEFQGGKKCAKMIKVDADTDFSKMRVGQLKELLRDRGVSCTECTEKKDFVQRLKEVIAVS